ncbi:MAG: phosphotransferase [Pararhodobacter sp.]|nr:phosphotransferase [Pararhodobacter sp.]
MAGTDMPLARLLEHLDRLAHKALALWDIPANARATRINVSENTTYLVEADGGFRAVLRVHRDSYHTRHAIQCELAWIDALDRDKVVVTPGHYRGRDGQAIQSCTIDGLDAPRFLVLFEFVEGVQPEESGDLKAPFEKLGAMAARMHRHTMSWTRPHDFERLIWDDATVFGPQATWGNWRDAPNVDATLRPVLEAAERTIRTRLAAYGKGHDRFGLIHADMRLANLLIKGTDTRLIDFDDCGFGWFMYDFAAAISFIETDPAIPDLKASWLRGYRRVRDLPASDEAEIETFIMMRRMALLAWIGSHIEAPEPQALAPHFATDTARLAQAWLERLQAQADKV